MHVYLSIGILITSYILFLIWLYNQTPTDFKVRDLKIPKKRFVLLVLRWCQGNLRTTTCRYDLKIYYYPNKRYLGQYHSNSKQIIIYINPEMSIESLVDTVIHEYVHHLQFLKNSVEGDYSKKLVELGYWNNPYEMEARKIAQQNRDKCLNWIQKNHQPF